MTSQMMSRTTEKAVLLIEDDPAVAETLVAVLEANDFHVRHANSGAEAKAMLEESAPDLVILDLMLPDADGLVLCADLKARAELPIIICSASNQTRDRILGFKLGADDFIGKPFNIAELEARVHAVLRRAGQNRGAEASSPTTPTEHQVIVVGDLAIEPRRRRVTLGGEVLQLTPTEYRLLGALANQPDAVLSREELAQQVWGYADAAIGRAIDAHIRRLRVKLASRSVPAPPIESVRGFGYKIVLETGASSAA